MLGLSVKFSEEENKEEEEWLSSMLLFLPLFLLSFPSCPPFSFSLSINEKGNVEGRGGGWTEESREKCRRDAEKGGVNAGLICGSRMVEEFPRKKKNFF
jgi:hypothetical protein